MCALLIYKKEEGCQTKPSACRFRTGRSIGSAMETSFLHEAALLWESHTFIDRKTDFVFLRGI